MSQKDQPEVIDPDDQRYKDTDHFNKHSQKPYAGTHQHQSYNYTKNVGCGCGPFGCLSGCITLILLSSLLTFLLNFLF